MSKSIPSEVALVSAVAALSCNTPQSRAPEDGAAAASSVVVVEPQARAKAGESSRVEEAPAEPEPERLDKLRENAAWGRLRSVWRALDDVEPARPKATGFRGAYAGSLDAKRAEALSHEADGAIRALRTEDLLSEAEAQYFRQAVTVRTQNMVRGFAHLSIMHRLPPPYISEKASSAARLERKIDVLLALRKQGKIGSRELALALEQVQDEAVTLHVVSSLSRKGSPIGPRVAPKEGETMLEAMQRRIVETEADGGAVDAPIADIVAKAEALVPKIRELIAELER